jgi:hypothetical protein
MGELLKQFNNERARTDLDEGAITQKKAAEAAGISGSSAGESSPSRQRPR